jgi:hypothetical protein
MSRDAEIKVPWPVRCSKALLVVQATLWAIVAADLVASAVNTLRLEPACPFPTCDSGEDLGRTIDALGVMSSLVLAGFAMGLASLSWLLATRLKPEHVNATVVATGLAFLQFVCFACVAGKGGAMLPVFASAAAFSLAIFGCLLNRPTWRFIRRPPSFEMSSDGHGGGGPP